MENLNAAEALHEMRDRIHSLAQRVDLDAKKRQLAVLEEQTSSADFWGNPKVAQQTMQQVSKLKLEIDRWDALISRLDDAIELALLNDESLVVEIDAETTALRQEVEHMSLQATLSGPYDNEDAILAIHAGAGGTDSQD